MWPLWKSLLFGRGMNRNKCEKPQPCQNSFTHRALSIIKEQWFAWCIYIQAYIHRQTVIQNAHAWRVCAKTIQHRVKHDQKQNKRKKHRDSGWSNHSSVSNPLLHWTASISTTTCMQAKFIMLPYIYWLYDWMAYQYQNWNPPSGVSEGPNWNAWGPSWGNSDESSMSCREKIKI